MYSCYYDIDTTSFIEEMGYYDHGSLEKVPSKQHIKDTLSEARSTRTIAQREQLSFNAPTKVIYMYSYFGVPGLFSHVHRHDFLIFCFNEVK